MAPGPSESAVTNENPPHTSDILKRKRDELEFIYRRIFILKQSLESTIKESGSDHLSRTIVDMVASISEACEEDPDSKALEENLKGLKDQFANECNCIQDALNGLESKLLGGMEMLESLDKRVVDSISSWLVNDASQL